MSIIISAAGIAIGGALTYGGIRKRRKYRGTFGESTAASNFSELVWPYTALRIGMVSNRSALRSELPKTPQIIPFGDTEFTGYGFDVVITVPGGRTASNYFGLEGNIQTLLRVDRVDPPKSIANGHQLSYRVYETIPTDNLQKLWRWEPELATNNASSIAFAMSQTKPLNIPASKHTMVVGGSGGGKSSIAAALFNNLVADETVEFWAIDAKLGGGDIKNWGHLCKRIAFASGPAGDLAMFMLLGQYAESFERQQSELPTGMGQWVPRGKKMKEDDYVATERNPTRILIIDEYNLFAKAAINFLAANKKSQIKQLAEELGYERDPLQDIGTILRGARSANHWIWAIGQKPHLRDWPERGDFMQTISLKLGESALHLLLKDDPAGYDEAKLAWEASVDGLSPAEWGDDQAGFAMVSDGERWQKARMYFSPPSDMNKLRKTGMVGSTYIVNHELGSSTEWSKHMGANRPAVGFDHSARPSSDLDSNTNSPEAAQAPRAPRAQQVAPAVDLQGAERAQWVSDAMAELRASGDKAGHNGTIQILREHGLNNMGELKAQGVSAKLWAEIEAFLYPSDGDEDEILPGIYDEAFSAVGVSDWEINLQNDETITDSEELAEAMELLKEAHPRIPVATARKITQLINSDLLRNGRTSYKRLAKVFASTQEKEGAL